jgi:putative transposase
LIDFVLTAGQRGDAPLGERLLEPYRRGQLGAIIADAAYDSDAIRERGRKLRARVCIKPNPTRKRKRRYDKRLYKSRNRIERFFARIKRARRIATRYEKKPENYAGFLWLAALIVDLL